MSTFGMQRGLAGAVVDGGIRDLAGVRHLKSLPSLREVLQLALQKRAILEKCRYQSHVGM